MISPTNDLSKACLEKEMRFSKTLSLLAGRSNEWYSKDGFIHSSTRKNQMTNVITIKIKLKVNYCHC